MSDGKKPVCAVVGVGPGNGAAFAHRFAAEGYAVARLARGTQFTADLATKVPGARAYTCDVADEASVARAFADMKRDMGDVEVLVYNAGSGVWGGLDDVTPKDFELVLRQAGRRRRNGLRAHASASLGVVL
jgi:NAD(P)-dependent dehydrogenase (short-subunit alcohol dehydrogenase family)